MEVAGSEDDEPTAKRLRTAVLECSLQAQANNDANQLITYTLADVKASVASVFNTMLAVSANMTLLSKDVEANKKSIADIEKRAKKAKLYTVSKSNNIRAMQACRQILLKSRRV